MKNITSTNGPRPRPTWIKMKKRKIRQKLLESAKKENLNKNLQAQKASDKTNFKQFELKDPCPSERKEESY